MFVKRARKTRDRDWSLATIDEINCQNLSGVQFSQLVPSNSGLSEACLPSHKSLVTPLVFPFVDVGKQFLICSKMDTFLKFRQSIAVLNPRQFLSIV